MTDIYSALSNFLDTKFRKFAKYSWLIPCEVVSIDEGSRVADVRPLGFGPTFKAALLQSFGNLNKGFVQFPAIGSHVLISRVSEAQAVIILYSEVTKTILTIGDTEITVADNAVSLVTKKVKADISGDTLKFDVNGTTLEMDGNKTVWNGGSETTANATNLKQELTKMSARIDGIIQAITASAVAPMDGGATYKANMATVVSALTKENFSQMIDDKIKH